MKLKPPELCIKISASRQQRKSYLKRKEPFVKDSWEHYVKSLNKETASK